MPKLLIETGHEINLDLFDSIKYYLAKIEQWWIIEIELPRNNIDNENFDRNEVKSGNMILLNHLIKFLQNEIKQEIHI